MSSLPSFDRSRHVDSHGDLPFCAWPGGYPLCYITQNCGVLCPKCANLPESRDAKQNEDPEWCVVAWEVNWECEDMYCDHCGCKIESAYGEVNP